MCAFFAKLLNVPTEPEPRSFNDPIFLIGSMRSGTTLLMNSLSEHPQILKIGFELNKVWTEIGGAPVHNGCLERTEKHFNVKYANNMTAYFSDYLNKSKSFIRKLSRYSQQRYYGSGGVNYDWEKIYLMNKSPHLSNKVRYIHSLYPACKFIVVVRSPFAQCASLKMKFLKSLKEENRYRFLSEQAGVCWQGFQGDRLAEFPKERVFPGNFDLLVEAWLDINYTMLKHLEHIPNDQKVILAYESIVQDNKESMNRIFKTLDLKKEHRNYEQKIITKERKIHNTSTSGNPLSKWKKHLDGSEQEVISTFLEKEKEKFEFIKNAVPMAANYWQL
tara:strand:+ start:724 stop:1719 length:996 start_codon:yes stop_codon:yes gene_type:complete